MFVSEPQEDKSYEANFFNKIQDRRQIKLNLLHLMKS